MDNNDIMMQFYAVNGSDYKKDPNAKVTVLPISHENRNSRYLRTGTGNVPRLKGGKAKNRYTSISQNNLSNRVREKRTSYRVVSDNRLLQAFLKAASSD